MIPRAKYHPAAPNSPLMTMGHGYEKRKTSAGSTEAKLLSYLDAGPSPNRVGKLFLIIISRLYIYKLFYSRKIQAESIVKLKVKENLVHTKIPQVF